MSFGLDLQKLEREARICRLLKHANIGGYINRIYYLFFSDEKTSDAKEIDKKKKKTIDLYGSIKAVEGNVLLS